MRVIAKTCVACTVLSVAFLPAPVRADGYFTPWIGVNLVSETDDGRRAFGVTTGYMGAGIFGFEGDVGYSPDVFGSTREFRATSIVTATGNFILGVPIGGTHGAGVRPFVSGGFGVMRAHTDAAVIADRSHTNNEFCYDVGAGAMGFFNQHVGVRGDVRYLRSLHDTNRGSGVDIDPGRLQSWRVSAGVTFR